MAASLAKAAKAAAVQLRDQLAGAGVPATLNPGDLNPPGAWVRVRTITPETLTAYTVRLDVYLVVGDANAAQAWDNLGTLLDKALTVVEPDEPVNTATSVQLPHGGPALPAMHLTVDELVDPTEEA
jgi:hypothetical protein